MIHKTHDFDFGANFFMFRQYDTPEENERYETAWKHLVPPPDDLKTVFDLAKKYLPDNELILNEAMGASFAEFHGRYSAYYLNIQD